MSVTGRQLPQQRAYTASQAAYLCQCHPEDALSVSHPNCHRKLSSNNLHRALRKIPWHAWKFSFSKMDIFSLESFYICVTRFIAPLSCCHYSKICEGTYLHLASWFTFFVQATVTPPMFSHLPALQDVSRTCKEDKHSRTITVSWICCWFDSRYFYLSYFPPEKQPGTHQSGISGETNEYCLSFRKHHKNTCQNINSEVLNKHAGWSLFWAAQFKNRMLWD